MANTREVLGDQVALDKIIDKSISSFEENTTIRALRAYAFCDCNSLTSAVFPNLSDIYASCFKNCTSLTTIDFSNATSIGDSAFYRCTALTSV